MSTLAWKPIPGFSAYEASEAGEIRRVRPDRRGLGVGRRLTSRPSRTGYRLINLVADGGVSRTVTVHRLVALAFLGAPPTSAHEVAHNDGDRGNNATNNLRWATRPENLRDRDAHGTNFIGERNPASKLTEGDVRRVRAMRKRGATMQQIGERFGVSRVAVRHVINGTTWSHVE